MEPTANPESVLTEAASVVRNGFKGTAGEVRYLFRVNYLTNTQHGNIIYILEVSCRSISLTNNTKLIQVPLP